MLLSAGQKRLPVRLSKAVTKKLHDQVGEGLAPPENP